MVRMTGFLAVFGFLLTLFPGVYLSGILDPHGISQISVWLPLITGCAGCAIGAFLGKRFSRWVRNKGEYYAKRGPAQTPRHYREFVLSWIVLWTTVLIWVQWTKASFAFTELSTLFFYAPLLLMVVTGILVAQYSSLTRALLWKDASFLSKTTLIFCVGVSIMGYVANDGALALSDYLSCVPSDVGVFVSQGLYYSAWYCLTTGHTYLTPITGQISILLIMLTPVAYTLVQAARGRMQ